MKIYALRPLSWGFFIYGQLNKYMKWARRLTTFSWTEFGPELDQESIETTCSDAIGGVNKTVTNSSYYQDKPNLYLKIISVVEN